MVFSPKSVLIVGGLEPFGIGFVNSLNKNYGSGISQIIVIGNPHPETNLADFSSDLLSNNEKFKIYYGDNKNEKLITKIVQKFEVDTVIHIPIGLCDPKRQSSDSVESGRASLLGVTHLMDALRKTETLKLLVQFSTLKVYGETVETQEKAVNGQINPESPFGAGLIGAEAMLHSYAMSYRMNIKILRIPDSTFWDQVPEKHVLHQNFEAKNKQEKINLLNINDVVAATIRASEHQGGVAEIFDIAGANDTTVESLEGYFSKKGQLNLSPTKIHREKILSLGWQDKKVQEIESLSSSNILHIPAVKLLIYGGRGWIGDQFVRLLESKNLGYKKVFKFSFFLCHSVTGEVRPGDDSDETLLEEFLRVAPSHVVSFLGRTHGPDHPNIDYLEGGPDKLHINVRDNLYAPWALANLCEKLGIHFTYLGTGCLFEYNEKHGIGGQGYTENDTPTFAGNKYSVVKGFTDRTLHFFSKTLNIRIRYPFNDEDSGRNLLRKLITFKKIIDIPNSITYLPDCLPILLDMCLKQQTGTINLVNPKPIRFPTILEIYQKVTGKTLEYDVESVENNPNATKTRAHCTLDTKKLEELYPTILTAEEAVKIASKNLKI